MSLSEVAAKFFQQSKLKYSEKPGGVFICQQPIEPWRPPHKTGFALFVRGSTISWLWFFKEASVHDSRRDDCVKLLSQINCGLSLGGFVLDPKDGGLQFAAATNLANMESTRLFSSDERVAVLKHSYKMMKHIVAAYSMTLFSFVYFTPASAPTRGMSSYGGMQNSPLAASTPSAALPPVPPNQKPLPSRPSTTDGSSNSLPRWPYLAHACMDAMDRLNLDRVLVRQMPPMYGATLSHGTLSFSISVRADAVAGFVEIVVNSPVLSKRYDRARSPIVADYVNMANKEVAVGGFIVDSKDHIVVYDASILFGRDDSQFNRPDVTNSLAGTFDQALKSFSQYAAGAIAVAFHNAEPADQIAIARQIAPVTLPLPPAPKLSPAAVARSERPMPLPPRKIDTARSSPITPADTPVDRSAPAQLVRASSMPAATTITPQQHASFADFPSSDTLSPPPPKTPSAPPTEYFLHHIPVIAPSALKVGDVAVRGSLWVVRHGMLYGSPVAVKVSSAATEAEDRAIYEHVRARVLSVQLPSQERLFGVSRIVVNANLVEWQLVSEWFDRGTLADVLYGRNEPLECDIPLERRLRLVLDAARMISYMHARNEVHGDVRPQNILVRDGALSAALIGSCALPESVGFTVVSPLAYGSPDDARTMSSDVYSFGVMLNEAVAVVPPWTDLPRMLAMIALQPRNFWAAVRGGQRPSVSSESVPPALADLIRSCWSPNAADRPAMPKVVERLARIIAVLEGTATEEETDIDVEPEVESEQQVTAAEGEEGDGDLQNDISLIDEDTSKDEDAAANQAEKEEAAEGETVAADDAGETAA